MMVCVCNLVVPLSILLLILDYLDSMLPTLLTFTFTMNLVVYICETHISNYCFFFFFSFLTFRILLALKL
jgi:hypothetical protein